MDGLRAREQICTSGVKLLEQGLVARTWGNISSRVDKQHFLITPSGKAYADLKPDDIALVNWRSGRFTGACKPSSEKGLHVHIYRTRPEIGAVIHTHQPAASVVATARIGIPFVPADLAQTIGPSIKCAAYALPSTLKLVRVTARALEGRRAALMANHGAVCVGRDLDEALFVAQSLEQICQTYIETRFLSSAGNIEAFDLALMHRVFLKRYGGSSVWYLKALKTILVGIKSLRNRV